nr:hypothetical protein [uncultured Blautia sp.]
MKKTKNYAMPYPEQDDYFNVEDFQDMMVSVDDLMKKLSDSGAQISSDAEHLYNQTKAQMDNIQKRMNAFTALRDGSTTGDAELKDIRVAYDGKEYGNAGEAVREQASDIHKALFGAGASIWSKAKSESTKYVAETKGICILNERFTAAGVVTKISRGTFAENESTLNLDRECSAYIVEFEKNPGTVYMPSAETIKIVSTTKIIFEANGNARCWIPVEKGQYLAVDSTATAYTSESNHVPYMLYDQANKTLECRGFGSTGSIEPVAPYSLALEYKLEYDMDDTGLVKQIDANREAAASLKGDLSQLSEEIVTISGSINPFTMTALNLFDDLEFLGKTYNGATSGLTIYNQETYTNTSENSNWSKAIPIRDSKGRQLFSFKWHKLDKAYNATIAVYFDVDGNYHSTIPMNTNTPNDIPNDVYYVSFVKYNNVGNYIVRDKVGVEWINANGERVYHVGTNGDYPTLTSALIGLKNDTSEKVIYIESGSYNIFEEMGGADYFDSLPEISNLSEWRTYCNLIPANTKIIGVGYVELNFNYGLTRINQGIFSCLNATTGTHIENVIINQTGGRYAIHFEGGTGANTNGNVYTLKNVIVNADIINPSIGVGTNVNSEIIIDNCVINNGVNTRPVFYHHTNHHGKGLILIKDSILHGQVDLQNWANITNGTNGVIVNIINSYVRVLKVFAVNSEVTVSDYTINVFGTNEYELISTNVTPLVNKFS